jgi:hypothetical protein
MEDQRPGKTVQPQPQNALKTGGKIPGLAIVCLRRIIYKNLYIVEKMSGGAGSRRRAKPEEAGGRGSSVEKGPL